jgi:hypothetical protein
MLYSQLNTYPNARATFLENTAFRFGCFIYNRAKKPREYGPSKCVSHQKVAGVTHGSSSSESKAENDISSMFEGVPIQNEKVQALWNKLDASDSFPKVKVLRLTKDKFLKVLRYLFDSLAEKDGVEYDMAAVERDFKGLSFQSAPNEFLVVIMENDPEAEEEVLVGELSKIAWHGFNKVFGEKWKEYVR